MGGFEYLLCWMTLPLGLAAWILPLVGLFFKNRRVFSFLSFSACALSLFSVIFYLGYKTEIGDWSALMDTVRGFRLASGSLVVGTILLNAVAGREQGG